ncbi:MAG TPA: substrate-binding domain-containing protein, partial [Dehalococcoidia bacterium]|nr:substrate-binding domain-containing protein [Dehalococcoidia bacterium]
VAYDAITIYLHPSNPLTKITKDQLACIYGEAGTCVKWTDAGVTVPGCANQEIVRVGRQSNSGTYAYFREWVVGEKGDFKLGSRDMQGSKDVVDLVSGTPCAIGYSGLGYKTASVKAACLAKTASDMCVEPSIESAVSGAYPLSRKLYMYTLGEAQGDVAGYLDWIRSDAGQAVVQQTGYAPLPKGQSSRPAAP